MLFASNVFMTFAWYGHLKFKGIGLPLVIVVSWGIAFFEYWLAVPVLRIASFTTSLKVLRDCIFIKIHLRYD